MGKSRRINRRTVLRGIGASVALPMLEAMIPSRIRGLSTNVANAAGPTKFMVVYIPNGYHEDTWGKVLNPGRNFSMPPEMAAFEPFRNDIQLLKNLGNLNNVELGTGGHAQGSGTLLTCTKIEKSTSNVRAGVSIDQLLAQQIGGGSKIRSLVIGPGDGSEDTPFSQIYTANISWASPTTPAARIKSPKILFDTIVANAGGSTPNTDAARRKTLKLLVVDAIKTEASGLKLLLGNEDKRRMDEYLTGVFELERKVNMIDTSGGGGASCTIPTNLPLNSTEWTTEVNTFLDLMVLAAKCDVTRVMTYMPEFEGNNRGLSQYLPIVKGGYHAASHYYDTRTVFGQYGELDYQMLAVNKFMWDMTSKLVQKLKATTTPTGNLLDESMVAITTGLGMSNYHYFYDFAMILAGKGGGQLNPGKLSIYPKDTPVANLWLSLARKMGSTMSSFGDSTGILTDL